MHLGTIQKPDGILSPIWPLSIKHLSQLPNEFSKHVLIVVGLYEGEVSIAIIVKSSDDSDPWLEHMINVRCLSICFLPSLSGVIGLSKPRFINRQYPLAILQQVEHLNCELLAHVLVPERIGMQRYLLHLLELEGFAHLEGFPDLSVGDLDSLRIFDILLNVPCRTNGIPLTQDLLLGFNDEVLLPLFVELLIVFLPQVLWIFLNILQEGLDCLSPNTISRANVGMVILLDHDIISDVQLLFNR